ncbi:hypothetical protein FLA_1283 [Filimonas lacunae]|nr:hypothetical protein FLA_1283 [Filimonas lacunae]
MGILKIVRPTNIDTNAGQQVHNGRPNMWFTSFTRSHHLGYKQ